MLQEPASGLRIGGDHAAPAWLEVSLPRVVHPSNGYLLRPEQTPAAVAAVRDMLATVAPGATLGDPTRLDLVAHLPIYPPDAIDSFRDLPHPKVRRRSREFFGSGLEWPGDGVHVRLYDKSLEQNGVRGDVTRLEFQLRRRKYLPSCWDGVNFDSLGLHHCYRRLALAFEPRRLVRPRGVSELLAWLTLEGVVVNGQRPLDAYLAGRSERQRRRILRAIQAAQVRYVALELDAMLPLGTWPEWIDVPPVTAGESLVA
jgi:hypothetical protein